MLSLLTIFSVTFCAEKDMLLNSEAIRALRQPWRQVDIDYNAVPQIYAQVLEVDLLEPYKAPNPIGCRGSGFFINDQGYIITNSHVIEEAARIWIRIPALGRRFIEVELVGLCPEKDIALLRLPSKEYDFIQKELGYIPCLSLGDSDSVRRADEVMALGYPLGQECIKSTTGVISGRHRHMIQMSAAINPGSSGGPLLNINGEVIGINTAGYDDAQNVNYIIPINDAKIILQDLEREYLLRKPFLGIFTSSATEAMVEYLGNPAPGGAYVVEVLEGGPLYKAGVRAGDMIYEIDGNPVDIYGQIVVPWSEDRVSLIDYASRFTLGCEITGVVYRKGERFDVTLKLDRPELLPIHQICPGYDPIDYEIFGGMVVMPLTINHVRMLKDYAPGLSEFANVQRQKEPVLVITHTFPTSLLYQAHILTPGILLNKINGQEVRTLDDFRQAIQESDNGFFTIQCFDTVTMVTDNLLVVLPYEEVIEEEYSLSQIYGYQPSATVKEIMNDLAERRRALHN